MLAKALLLTSDQIAKFITRCGTWPPAVSPIPWRFSRPRVSVTSTKMPGMINEAGIPKRIPKNEGHLCVASVGGRIDYDNCEYSRNNFRCNHNRRSLAFPPFKTWHMKAPDQPLGKVRIGEDIYPVELELVEPDSPEFGQTLTALAAKYPNRPPSTEQEGPGVMIFQLAEPR